MPRNSRVHHANALHNAYSFTSEPYANNPEGYDIQKKLSVQFVKDTASKGGKSSD